jgi:WD repeat-containing protein 23
LFELLASSGLQHILQSNGWVSNAAEDEEVDDDDDDEPEYYLPTFRHRLRARRTRGDPQFPKVPSDAGTELMGEGQFGTDQHFVDRLKKRKMGFATNLMWRELGVDAYGVRRRADQAISQVRMLRSRLEDP